MIEDQYYMPAFFTSITILCTLGMLPTLRYRDLKKFPPENLLLGTLLLLLTTILFIGLRNPYGSWVYFGDTYNYTVKYLKIQADPTWTSKKDLGFYYYMKLMAKMVDIQTFFLITAMLYVLPAYFTFYKWFNKNAFFVLILLVSSMSFWPFGINGMRNGLATSFFIFALAFKEKRILMYTIMAIAISFHTSVLLPAIALVITEFYNNTKFLIKLWLLSICISFFFGKSLMNNLNLLVTSSIGQLDGRGDFSGVDASSFATSSFRIDFIIYSGVVVALGFYFTFKLHFNDSLYKKLLNTYIISNTVWLYFIYFPYTNRIAYLSWFLIPILIAYPVVFSKNLKNQSYFMATALAISLIFVWTLAYL